MKKKSKLKRLLDYCPRPSKPFITTLKHSRISKIILVIGTITIFVTISYFLLFSGSPIQPTPPQTIPAPQTILPTSLPEIPTEEPIYYPGVIVGDYVKYGDFFCNVSHPADQEWEGTTCLGEVDWKIIEVIGVAGKGVAIRYTEQLKNGNSTSHNGCVHIIENIDHPTWVNGSCWVDTWFLGPVVAANLTEGGSIHGDVIEPCRMQPHTVNKTEIRTYLGVSRWVNIMKLIDEPRERTWVFDGETGMLLELEEIAPNNQRTSYRIIETNIFSSPETSSRSALIQKNLASEKTITEIFPIEDPYPVDDWVATEFKVRIGIGKLNSSEEEDVVLQPHGEQDYLLVEEYMSESFWLPPSTEENAEYEGGWSLGLGNINLAPDEEPEFCGTCAINDHDLIDKLIQLEIHPIKEKEVNSIIIGHVIGNLWRTENEVGPLGDFWRFGIMWRIGTLSIPDDPEPIVIPHIYRLEGETDRGIDPEGEYDENTDSWIVNFNTVFELVENTNEPYDPKKSDEENARAQKNKLWEGPLSFTVEIQRLST